jgi:hypothetical protein
MGLCLGRPQPKTKRKVEQDSVNGLSRPGGAGRGGDDSDGAHFPALHSPMPQEESLNTSSIFVFPQITDEVQEQWKVRC